MKPKLTSLSKIKKLLEGSQSPLYLYDDDPDGLCSFLLLKRFFKKGEGMVIKTTPRLTADFFPHISGHSYDIVVILDKPIVDQELIDRIKKPVIYIDHHPLQELKGVYYYNPRLKNKSDNSPTTKICYDIVKQDEWIAGIGIISDWFIPKFFKKLLKKYPDMLQQTKNPAEIMFDQKFGELTRRLSFILKGDNHGIKKCTSMLERAKEPYEILDDKDSIITQRFHEVNAVYKELLDSASKERARGKIIVFSYISGKFSLTGDLANEIYYRNPENIVIIAREKDDDMKISLRGKNVAYLLKKALEGINGYGGGHDNACGASVKKEDFTRFIGNFKRVI